MEAFIIAITLLGLISSFLVSAKGMQHLLFAAAGVCLLLVPAWAMEGEETKVLWSLIAMVGIAYVASLFGVSGSKLAAIPALLGLFLPCLLLIGKETIYLGFELKWTLLLTLFPLLGAAIPLLANLKAHFLSKWLDLKKDSLASGISALIATIVVLFATFKAQYFGVFLVGAGWLTISLVQRKNDLGAGPLGLLVIGLAFMLMKQNNAVDDSFLRGNFLMGLIAGAAVLNSAIIFSEAGRLKWLFTYLLPVIFILAIVGMGSINLPFGGMPAFAGALMGAGVTAIVSRKGSTIVPLLLMLTVLVIPVQSKFGAKEVVEKTDLFEEEESEELDQPITDTNETAVEGQVATPADTIAASTIAGTWKAIVAKSTVNFELGPEGSVTKGAVKDFDVTLVVGADGKPTNLDVIMPIVKVTTFDDTRDEHIHAADFLNADAFPKAEFHSTSVVQQGKNYLVKGHFTLMGKKKPMTLKVRLAGTEELMMTGATQFDRSTHGMESDPSIGDVVSVSWKLKLNRK